MVPCLCARGSISLLPSGTEHAYRAAATTGVKSTEGHDVKVAMLVTAAVTSTVIALLLGREAEVTYRTESTYTVEEPVCEITDERLTGLSGMAVRDGETWMVNDRGGVLFRLRSCKVADQVSLEDSLEERDVELRDVEALAAGPGGWLWLADTGGNNEARREVTLVGWRDRDTPLQLVTLTYPKGVHDVEAVLVGHDQHVVRVGKTEDESAPVFESDGALRDGATLPLTLRGTITLSRPEGARPGARLVTDGAVSPFGVNAVLRTYTNAWEYDVVDLDLAGALVDGDPRLVPLPASQQGEAVAYTSDGQALLATGEGNPVDLDAVAISRRAVPVR